MLNEIIILAGITNLTRIIQDRKTSSVYYIMNSLYTELNPLERRVRYIQWRLYRECSSENFDYYGITDETSCGDYICPLCKLGHDDEEIEGRYKAGSYFIKCEQREIEIVA